MSIVSREIELAEAVADGPALEAQMDQRKPATPVASHQASKVSDRRDASPAAPSPPSTSPPAAPQGDPPPPRRRGDVPIDQHISHQLRAIYDEVVNEPIPDRFVKLLEELERKQAGKS